MELNYYIKIVHEHNVKCERLHLIRPKSTDFNIVDSQKVSFSVICCGTYHRHRRILRPEQQVSHRKSNAMYAEQLNNNNNQRGSATRVQIRWKYNVMLTEADDVSLFVFVVPSFSAAQNANHQFA